MSNEIKASEAKAGKADEIKSEKASAVNAGEINAGIRSTEEITVTDEMTAKKAGSGDLEVFSTPNMVALMEKTCLDSVRGYLDGNSGTVGTLMDIKHVSATPVGMKVRCESVLKEVDRRRLVFEVKAYDEAGLIGEGVHERFIIDNDKFTAKAYSKLENK
jgi:fluoroacetyl-CoA thioesterase